MANKKYRTFLQLVAIISFSFILSSPLVLASPLQKLQGEKQLLTERKLHLQSGFEQKENELEKNTSTIVEIQKQIQIVDDKLNETVGNVKKSEVEIMNIQEEMELLYSSISYIEKNIKERDDVLRERIRSLQLKEDPTNFFDVLLGSTSVLDFVGRVTTVNTLMKADRKIMKQHKSDIEQLVENKLLVSQSLSKQNNNKKSLQELEVQLALQKNEKDDLVRDLEVEQNILTDEIEKLEVAYNSVLKKSDEIDQDIIALQNRQLSFSSSNESESMYSSPLKCSSNSKIDDNLYFAKFKKAGVFTEKGQVFIDIANEYNIDPVLMAAIAFHETGSGTSNALVNYNNPGGLMNPETNWATLLRFDTLEEGLRSTGRTLDRLVHKGGLTTIGALGSVYAPIGAKNDPTGLNKNWTPNVTKIVNELGGLTISCTNK